MIEASKFIPTGISSKVRNLFTRKKSQTVTPKTVHERWNTTPANAEIIKRNNKKLIEDLNKYFVTFMKNYEFAINSQGKICKRPRFYSSDLCQRLNITELSDKQVRRLIEIMRNGEHPIYNEYTAPAQIKTSGLNKIV